MNYHYIIKHINACDQVSYETDDIDVVQSIVEMIDLYGTGGNLKIVITRNAE